MLRIFRILKDFFVRILLKEKRFIVIRTSDEKLSLKLEKIFEKLGCIAVIESPNEDILIKYCLPVDLIVLDDSKTGFDTARKIRFKNQEQKIVMIASPKSREEKERFEDNLDIEAIRSPLLFTPVSKRKVKDLLAEIEN